MFYNYENVFKYLFYIDLYVEYIYYNVCIYIINIS